MWTCIPRYGLGRVQNRKPDVGHISYQPSALQRCETWKDSRLDQTSLPLIEWFLSMRMKRLSDQARLKGIVNQSLTHRNSRGKCDSPKGLVHPSIPSPCGHKRIPVFTLDSSTQLVCTQKNNESLTFLIHEKSSRPAHLINSTNASNTDVKVSSTDAVGVILCSQGSET